MSQENDWESAGFTDDEDASFRRSQSESPDYKSIDAAAETGLPTSEQAWSEPGMPASVHADTVSATGANEPSARSDSNTGEIPSPDMQNLAQAAVPAEAVVYAADTSDRKRRGPIFWLGVLGFAVFLVAVIGGTMYWLSRPTIDQQAFMQDATAEYTPDVADVQTSLPPVVADTIPYGPAENVDAGTATAAPEPAPAKTAEPADHTVHNNQPKSIVRTEKSKPAAVANNTPRPIPERRPEASNQKPEPVPQQQLRGGTQYVVQVFSSPSRADANEWLQILREKNINDGYIAQQEIRGESWYRVRFGDFKTYEDAMAAARSAGIRQPWVARVR